MTRRFLFLAALVVGASYVLSDAVTTAGLAQVVWKGAGVGLLALWAASRARLVDGWLLAAAFAIYAAADVLIDTHGLVVGGAAFALGHSAMIALYLRHRGAPAAKDWMIALLLGAAVPLAAFMLPERPADGLQVALYAAVLGMMAAAAWLSSFRRDRVLLGALLFVVSDLLIFARLGVLADSGIPGLLVWPLYFAGQALIAHGVVRGLEGRR